MIQPAFLPASAQLLLAIDPQGEIGGSSGAESPFSVLLEAEIGAGLTGLAKEDIDAPAPGQRRAKSRRRNAASGPASRSARYCRSHGNLPP